MKDLKKICIIDADFGNIASIENAIKFLGYEYETLKKPKDLETFTHLILPGVGSFNKSMKKLILLGWKDCLIENAKKDKPILGICLGMQLMFESGDEHGEIEGLGLFKGSCKNFSKKNKIPLPHIGFNLVNHNNSKIWDGISNPAPFYFVHSYRVEKTSSDAFVSTTFYGEEFISFIEKKNIFGAQFHPEKSHYKGLKLIKNFMELK